MKKYYYLFISFLFITIAILIVWFISKYIQPLLPLEINNSIFLIGASITGVITVLSGVPTIIENTQKIIKKIDNSKTTSYNNNSFYRDILLNRVYKVWIEGYLKNSLFNEICLDLGMELRPDFITNPWAKILQMPNQPSVNIPSSTRILDVFNDCGKAIAVLGEPGSGKTTELLLLAKQIIEESKTNKEQPIPVFLNLSTWNTGLSIKDWIITELSKRYQINQNLGNSLLSTSDLMFLLDGLDEVKPSNREQCVKKINEFLNDYLCSIAICCRKNEYDELKSRPNVNGVILIQPLNNDIILDFLQKYQPNLTNLFIELSKHVDRNSDNFFYTPLFLNIFVLSYPNASSTEMESLKASTNYQKLLFETFILKMFSRRGSPQFTFNKSLRWLSWIAKEMFCYDHTEFFVEDVFEYEKPRILLSSCATYIIIILTGLVFAIGVSLKTNLNIGIFSGLLFCLPFGLLINHFSKVNDDNRYYVDSIGDFITSSIPWVICSLIFGIILWLSSGLFLNFLRSIAYGILASLIVPLFINESNPPTLFDYSREQLPHTTELLNKKKEVTKIRNSPSNSIGEELLIIIITTPVYCGLLLIFTRLAFGKSLFDNVGVITTLVLGLLFAMKAGGYFLLTYYLTQIKLIIEGKIPFSLKRFLEFATEKVILRKVGDGYIFVHRLILEYFAYLKKE